MTISLHSNFHLGVIMDGNGRWAEANGLSRAEGHEAGVKRLETLYDTALAYGVRYLTIYAFSTENWSRSDEEVETLMTLFQDYLDSESDNIVDKGIQIRFIGDSSRFSEALQDSMNELELKTTNNKNMTLFVAMNYGGQDEIIRASNSVLEKGLVLTQENVQLHLDTAPAPMLDLVIRTSGELRLSNFMIWQAAYAELYFCSAFWPDFDEIALEAALLDYQSRQRRFGGRRYV